MMVDIPGHGTLEIHTAEVEVTSGLPYANPAWTYTDTHGHAHHYEDGYPTLTRVVDARYWVPEPWEWDEPRPNWGEGEGPGEWVEEDHLECPQCGEHITPGTTIDSYRRFIRGPRSAYLNGEPISGERAEELLAILREEGTES